MTRLTFLGTGGGRFATMTQARGTGGLYIEDGASRLHIDPGPGALLRMHEWGLDPSRTTALLVSHAHLDHCNDAAVLIEAMTRGGLDRRGFMLASRSVLQGSDGLGPILTAFHRKQLASAEIALPGRTYRVSGHRIDAFATEHSDPTNVAFRVHTSGGDVAYFTDSAYRKELVTPLAGSRVLVLGVTRPRGARIENHLSTEDAVEVALLTKPDVLVLTHLGLKVLHRGPDGEAAFVQRETGVRTVAARDGMVVELGESVAVTQPRQGRRHHGPRNPKAKES